PLVVVTNGGGQVEVGVPARADEDEVLEGRVREADLAADHVGEGGHALAGGTETDDRAVPRRNVAVAAEAVVAGGLTSLGASLDLLTGAVAAVGPPLGQEPLGRLLVELGPLGLTVRALVPV